MNIVQKIAALAIELAGDDQVSNIKYDGETSVSFTITELYRMDIEVRILPSGEIVEVFDYDSARHADFDAYETAIRAMYAEGAALGDLL